MAQGAVALQNGVALNGAAMTADDLREILEYERIVQFRDTVLAGSHPRIKIPSHLAGKHSNTSRLVPSSTHPTSSTFAAYSEKLPSNSNKSPDTQRQGIDSHPSLAPKPPRSEINPILLEKSDDLIKAEMQLQRQRLERALRDQIEQQRIAQKAVLQASESLPNFDISEVLRDALVLVEPSTAPEIELPVAIQSPGSDSFDENTFYSSQHESPMSNSSSQGLREQGEVLVRDLAVDSIQAVKNFVPPPQPEVQGAVMAEASLSKDKYPAVYDYSQTQKSPPGNQILPVSLGVVAAAGIIPSSTCKTDSKGITESAMIPRSNGSGSASTQPNNSTDSASISQVDIDRAATQKTTEELLKQAFEDHVASPLIRAHDLSPIAPQPARVSPLATAREPPVLREAISMIEPLTNLHAAPSKQSMSSSTDSSPPKQKARSQKKEKKDKKKPRKRKAKDNADTPDSTYIKPEPRSPSPFSAAPLPRPQKRQRQVEHYASELNYDEPRYEPQPELQERVPHYKEVRVRRADDQFDEQYDPDIRRPDPVYQRIDGAERSYRRVSGTQYPRRPKSPSVYVTPHDHGELRPLRAASHSVLDRRVAEDVRYYREPVPKVTLRPDADRERSRSPIMRERRSPPMMAPPRQPVRILVDAYGREYIEPAPAPPTQIFMAPPSRYRDSEIVYERAPMRSVSTRPQSGVNEDRAVVYRNSPQPLVVPRRVVTQPEYAQPEYRSYRQREYSARPQAPLGEEYIQIRGPPERRHPIHFEEVPSEHGTRAPSIRPEPVRYEIPRDYLGRLHSVRPDLPVRDYTARPEQPMRENSVRPEPPVREYSVRPEIRREMVSQPQREFSMRHVESIAPRDPIPILDSDRHYEGVATRRVIAPDGGRGYEAIPSGRLVVDGQREYEEVPRRRLVEPTFIERPSGREPSVVMYGDEGRREMYR